MTTRVEFTFSCQTRLTYVLNQTWTARMWVAQLSKMRPDFLLRTDLNHRHGFAGLEEIRSNLRRLRHCAQTLGFPMERMNERNWQNVLNRLHVRFPEFFKTQFERKHFQTAHELNLSIHWLEYELANLHGGKRQYIFNLDFNHFPHAYNLKAKFPDDEFQHFSPALEFGNLHLHYIYIGRHFLEMFDARDTVCPANHFRAQHEFNATCGLVFSEPTDGAQLDQAMRDYYALRGGENFFGFAFDAPKLAKGFFKVGQLENLQDYGEAAQRQALRDKLKSSLVRSWRIIPGVPETPGHSDAESERHGHRREACAAESGHDADGGDQDGEAAGD